MLCPGNIRSVDAKGSKGIKPWPDVVRRTALPPCEPHLTHELEGAEADEGLGSLVFCCR